MDGRHSRLAIVTRPSITTGSPDRACKGRFHVADRLELGLVAVLLAIVALALRSPNKTTRMIPPMTDLNQFLTRAERLLERLERSFRPKLPPPTGTPPPPSVGAAATMPPLVPVPNPHRIRLDDLQDIEEKKDRIVSNTRQFLAGKRANNVLLTAPAAPAIVAGQSLLNEFADAGLRLIEVDKDDLVDLPDIVALLEGRPERFILFTDDLSFEDGEPAYKALKSVLDGSLAAVPDNVLIYATSNRRHLMPEYFSENAATKHKDGEVHPAEAVEENLLSNASAYGFRSIPSVRTNIWPW
jgi:predicted AAA+ superfamily ATPase